MTCFRYWPKDKPIPDGWVKTGRMEDSHHGYWSIIIMQTEDRYGWDCAIGSLLSKGGTVAKKEQYVPAYNTYQWLVYDDAGNEVGTIYARPDDWIGEDRIRLIDGEQND